MQEKLAGDYTVDIKLFVNLGPIKPDPKSVNSFLQSLIGP